MKLPRTSARRVAQVCMPRADSALQIANSGFGRWNDKAGSQLCNRFVLPQAQQILDFKSSSRSRFGGVFISACASARMSCRSTASEPRRKEAGADECRGVKFRNGASSAESMWGIVALDDALIGASFLQLSLLLGSSLHPFRAHTRENGKVSKQKDKHLDDGNRFEDHCSFFWQPVEIQIFFNVTALCCASSRQHRIPVKVFWSNCFSIGPFVLWIWVGQHAGSSTSAMPMLCSHCRSKPKEFLDPM